MQRLLDNWIGGGKLFSWASDAGSPSPLLPRSFLHHNSTCNDMIKTF